MTKVPANVPDFAAGMTYGPARMQGTDAAGEFGRIFEEQKNAASEVKASETHHEEDTALPQENVVKEAEGVEVTGETEDASAGDGVKEVSQAQTEQETDEGGPEGWLSEEEMNLILPMLQTAAGDIRQMLAQELGISSKELDSLLESMGLDSMDLLNQETLKDVVLQARGIQDMTALLTNEELYTQLQSVNGSFEEVMSNVQDTLQMTEKELIGLKEQLANMSREPVVTIEAEGVPAAMQKDSAAEERSSQNHAFTAPNQNLMKVQENVSQVSTVQTGTGFISAETENIMNQIMDYMKIQLHAESSTLEMQLQPESLGTLQIRISAREGIMTAQFTTASETVKAALESQMLQLQQQFESQNIKVDAIEVTVQAHQFENALEQGNERRQTEDGKRNRVRKIDLKQLEEAEEIPQEDRIVAEMMAVNGSTVDYLA